MKIKYSAVVFEARTGEIVMESESIYSYAFEAQRAASEWIATQGVLGRHEAAWGAEPFSDPSWT